MGGGSKGHFVTVVKLVTMPTRVGRDHFTAALKNHMEFIEAEELGLEGEGEGKSKSREGNAAVDSSRVGRSPPRWGLPPRQQSNPQSYAKLVECMHGYVRVHAEAAAVAAPPPGAAVDGPEWVVEQAWRLAVAMWGQEAGMAQDLPLPGDNIISYDSYNDKDGGGGSGSGTLLPFSAETQRQQGGGRGGHDTSPIARRQAAIAAWLKQAVGPCGPENLQLEETIQVGARAGRGPKTWRLILELLTVNKVEEAAFVAAGSGLPRLSVVLAAATTAPASSAGRGRAAAVGWPGPVSGAAVMAGGGRGVKEEMDPCEAIRGQLTQWGESCERYLPREASLVYTLLGRVNSKDLWLGDLLRDDSDRQEEQQQDQQARHPSLDWLRQVGLCLWHREECQGDIAAAFSTYERLAAGGNALRPVARYLTEPTHFPPESMGMAAAECRRSFLTPTTPGGAHAQRDRCILGCLLTLVPSSRGEGSSSGGGGGGGGGSIVAALEPLSVTPDPLDFRHSWHLMTVVEALGLARPGVPPQTRAAVSEGIRLQLVGAGLWEWAVYVALTTGPLGALPGAGDDEGVLAAKELVLRYGYDLADITPGGRVRDRERRALLDSLRVPTAWIEEAGGLRAGYEHRAATRGPIPRRGWHHTIATLPEHEKDGTAGVIPMVTTTTPPSTSTSSSPPGGAFWWQRETKLRHLLSAGLNREAADEVCALVPVSIYLGGGGRERMVRYVREIGLRLQGSGW
ncbi:unnamed protein product, partial [Discosporangium mesarthrocarpum]